MSRSRGAGSPREISSSASERLATAAIAGSVAAVALSAYLTYVQPKKTGAWRFWCLSSAVISAAAAPIAVSAAIKILRENGSGDSALL